MSEAIRREEKVHGAKWESVHGGYFSDPAVAAPLAEKAKELIEATGAEAVVDLGGGTGYVLGRIRAAGVGDGVAMTVLDGSAAQLAAARAGGFAAVKGAVDAFARGEVVPEGKRALFTMRSVLHYFGEAGLGRTLAHLRRQAREGEYFLHQTASFARREDAECLNELYREMGTGKWYPAVERLEETLAAGGWRVAGKWPAAPLRLASEDLAKRYGLGAEELERIERHMERHSGVPADVFARTGEGFEAYLHYWIYACAAE